MKKATPLIGGYLVPYIVFGYALSFIDWFLGFLVGKLACDFNKRPVRKILLSNPAHLGDVLIASSVLPALQKRFPDAEFGIIVGSWARQLASDIPGIKHIHAVDHWKLNRRKISRIAKIRKYLSTQKNALSEIKAVGYDMAIDLYFYYPNSATLFWRANIPIRLGVVTGGFGNLYTHCFSWNCDDQHQIRHYARMLEVLGIEPQWIDDARPVIGKDPQRKSPLTTKVKKHRVVVHMGTGDPKKNWPQENWLRLVAWLHCNRDMDIHFTGASESETNAINIIMSRHEGGTNWSQKLSWDQFVGLIADSDLLIGVDSVAGHVAAAVDTPCIIISAAMGNPNHWRPLGTDVIVFTHKMACAPCYNGKGCEAMTCVRGVKVEDVVKVVCEKLVIG